MAACPPDVGRWLDTAPVCSERQSVHPKLILPGRPCRIGSRNLARLLGAPA
jgi:hypothetical protein